MNKTVFIFISFIFASIFLFACCKSEEKRSQAQIAVVDSATERQSQALKVVAQYPMSEWSEDILAKISSVAGQAVSDQVKNLVQERLGAKELMEKRISLLTEIYSASELNKLAELYSSSESKAILRKSSVYDDRLRELTSPIIMEVLSNAR